MSAKSEINSSHITFLQSPQLTFFTLFAAVVVGSSLLEFNELLFPPKITSISFWALLPVYVAALDAWFGVLSWARYMPYMDKPLFRILAIHLVLAWTVLLALMFLASRVPDSLLSYLWGLVVLFIITTLGCIIRFRATKTPEPFVANVVPGTLAIVAAITYSIWMLNFHPIPDTVNWVFVSIAFAILIGFRVWLKLIHAWRPEEKR